MARTRASMNGLVNGVVSAGVEDKVRELYGYGMRDPDIAKRLSVITGTVFTKSMVRSWRRGLGLPGFKYHGEMTKAEHAKRLELYRLGWSDSAIGRSRGVKLGAILEWRANNGLLANRPNPRCGHPLPEHEEDRRMAMYRRGMTDAQIAHEVNRKVGTIGEWRAHRALPRNVPEREWLRPPTTIVSMDANLGEDGFNRHAFVADDAAAAWLEEMGATVS